MSYTAIKNVGRYCSRDRQKLYVKCLVNRQKLYVKCLVNKNVLLEIVKRVIRNVSIEIVQEIVICVIDWLL